MSNQGRWIVFSNPSIGEVAMCAANHVHKHIEKGTIIEAIVNGTIEDAKICLTKIQNTYFRVCDDYHPDVGF